MASDYTYQSYYFNSAISMWFAMWHSIHIIWNSVWYIFFILLIPNWLNWHYHPNPIPWPIPIWLAVWHPIPITSIKSESQLMLCILFTYAEQVQQPGLASEKLGGLQCHPFFLCVKHKQNRYYFQLIGPFNSCLSPKQASKQISCSSTSSWSTW